MKSLNTLQTKYELSYITEAVNELYFKKLFEAIGTPTPVVQPAPATAPAATTQTPVVSAAQQKPAATPAQQAAPQTPQDLEKAVEADPKQLPGLIQTLVNNVKQNPQALAALQAAVAKNDVKAVQQLAAQYAPKEEETFVSEQIDYILKHVNTLSNKDEVRRGLQEYVESNGDVKVLRRYDEKYDENVLSVYKEYYLQEGIWDAIKSVGKGIWQGIKNVGAAASPIIGKYGPWAALGALAGGPLGAMALPLLAKALGGKGGETATNKPEEQKLKPINKMTTADLSSVSDEKYNSLPLMAVKNKFKVLNLTPEEEQNIEKGATLNVADKQDNTVQFTYKNGLMSFIKVSGGSGAAPAPTPSTTPALTPPLLTPTPPPVNDTPPSVASKPPVVRKPKAKSATINVKDNLYTLAQVKNAKNKIAKKQYNGREELMNLQKIAKNPKSGKNKLPIGEKTFMSLANKIINEMHNTSGVILIEKANG
jgi:Asp-tRNA(Asn)/Glu-tRNA(Gln) amidotransferase C subunit